jgi:hypothetical protein
MLINNNTQQSLLQSAPQRVNPNAPKEQPELSEIETDDIALQGFRKALEEGGGTGSSIQRINLEKIEQALEEKRKELEAKYNINAEPPLSPEQMKSAMKAIEEEMADFMKDFFEKMALRDGIQKEPGGTLPRGMLLSMAG